MKVAALRFTQRFNTGNYQFEEIAVEAVPDEGQTAEELLAETRDFVNGNSPNTNGAPVSNGKPPLAKEGNGKAESSDPTKGSNKTDSGAGNGGKTNGSAKNGNSRGRGRPPKAVTEAKKAVAYALEAEDLEEFADRFADARELGGALNLDEWEDSMKQFAARYRELNDPTVDEEIVSGLIKAFKAEKTSIEERRNG